METTRINEYGPGAVGKRKSSFEIGLGMVFSRVRGDDQNQGIWAGSRQEAKIIV